MPWNLKGKYERISAGPHTEPRVDLPWLLRTAGITALLLLALVLGPHASGAETRRLNVTWIPIVDGIAQPTAAWSEFCERDPAECAINPAEPATIKLNERVWNSIAMINNRVNAAVSPQEDMPHWGVIDRWDFPDDGYGDCEDY